MGAGTPRAPLSELPSTGSNYASTREDKKMGDDDEVTAGGGLEIRPVFEPSIDRDIGLLGLDVTSPLNASTNGGSRSVNGASKGVDNGRKFKLAEAELESHFAMQSTLLMLTESNAGGSAASAKHDDLALSNAGLDRLLAEFAFPASAK